VTEQVRNRLFSISRLDELKDLTFETFKPRGRKGLGEMQVQSLEWAYNHSRQYAASLRGWLLLMGGYGSGKTHLAAAIANFVVQIGGPALFLTVPDLLDTLRFSYDSVDTTFEDRFDQIRNAGLLVLDDFGTQNATGWAQEKLFQIINYRYINKLPLVITTNLALDEIEPRIRSRLQDPELVTTVRISSPDYRRPVDDMGHSELSSLDLHSSRTFASFVDRNGEELKPDELDSLENAIKEALAFAKRPQGWLVFSGPYGCGKTHLAAAIANQRAGLGDPPLFVMVPDLLDHLRAAFAPNSGISYDRRFDEVRTTSLLILDDLGSQSATPWAKEKLYQLLNYRYNCELPTVITVPVNVLNEVDERIRTRMMDARICKKVLIIAPAFIGAKQKVTRKPRRN
jgi:DNA replication protein DnaC